MAGKPRPRVAWFRDNRLLVPEPDDLDDTNGGGGAQKSDVITSVDGCATATVTKMSSTVTGGGDKSFEEVVEVDLILTGLTRSDLHTELTCRAWNYFYDDEEYSIVVTNSGITSLEDTDNEKETAAAGEGDVDPSRWTPRQRQSSSTAVVHVDMNCEYTVVGVFKNILLFFSSPMATQTKTVHRKFRIHQCGRTSELIQRRYKKIILNVYPCLCETFS